MSLLVNAYTRGPDGEMIIIEPEDHSHELAGYESYRQQLYGSRAALALGLQLLPILDGGNVYAEGEDVERLRAEAVLALANVGLFEAETGASSESLRARFANIITAASRAAAVGGGVVIW